MNDELITTCADDASQGGAGKPPSDRTIMIRPDISMAGRITDAGSKALAGFQAISDATVVARLKAAGASFTGSAHMAELGFGLNGDTMALALSAELARAGLMNDTMGECRLAACSVGWCGFKPTWGLVSRHGLIGLAPSMESIGILGRNPDRIAELLAVMAGPDEADFSMSVDPLPDFTTITEAAEKPFRIGLPREVRNPLSTPAAGAFAAAVDTMAEAGFEMVDVSLPGFDLFPTVHQVIAAVEASSAAGRYDGVRFGHRAASAKNWNEMYLNTRSEAFGLRVKAFLFQGAWFQFQNYPAFEKACALRRRLVRETAALFQQVDLLALPGRPAEPDPFQADTVQDTYAAFGLTLAANVAGLPALQIPGLNRNTAVDYGLQLIGPARGDVSVLAAGRKISTHLQGDFPE